MKRHIANMKMIVAQATNWNEYERVRREAMNVAEDAIHATLRSGRFEPFINGGGYGYTINKGQESVLLRPTELQEQEWVKHGIVIEEIVSDVAKRMGLVPYIGIGQPVECESDEQAVEVPTSEEGTF